MDSYKELTERERYSNKQGDSYERNSKKQRERY